MTKKLESMNELNDEVLGAVFGGDCLEHMLLGLTCLVD